MALRTLLWSLRAKKQVILNKNSELMRQNCIEDRRVIVTRVFPFA